MLCGDMRQGRLTRRSSYSGQRAAAPIDPFRHRFPARALQDDVWVVVDAFDVVTVPAQPERVIAVRDDDVVNMLAPGVPPMA